MDRRKKEFIKELTGIDNIEFIVSTEFCPSEVFIDENVNIDDYVNTEEIEERVVAWAQFGNKIENFGQDGGTILGASTLGAVAEYKDDSDSVLYITTGHGMEEGDQIYLVDSDGYGDNGAGKLGEVVDVSIGTDMDIALIEQTNDSTVVPINEKRDGTEIYDAGNAIEGHVGEISSWQNQPVIGFDEVWADVSWNDPDHNDVGWYENLLQLHTVTGATESGDSGSPVFMYEFSDEDGTVINQILVGIYKGRGRDGYLYATRWDTVEDYYDVEMKVFQ